MRLRLEHFNVAPQVRRHSPLTWIVLVASGAVALFCAWPLSHSMGALQEAQFRAQKLQAFHKHQTDEARKLMVERTSASALERSEARAQVLQAAGISWNGILDALERSAHAVHGGVTIIALTPVSVKRSSAKVSLSALAANAPVMWSYVATLKNDPRISDVELSTHRPDEKTGPNTLRFQLSVVWSPMLDADPALSPEAIAYRQANLSFVAHQAARQ